MLDLILLEALHLAGASKLDANKVESFMLPTLLALRIRQ